MDIGDKVKVINTALSYPVYTTLFKSLGFKKTSKNYNSDLNNTECIIFNRGDHPETGISLVAIRHLDGRELLIEKAGVVLMSKVERKLFKLL